MSESKTLEQKLAALEDIITKYKKVCVAYSGGVDSSLLLYLTSRLAKETIAVTAFGPMLPMDEFNKAMEFTMSLGNVDFLFTPVDPMQVEDFKENTPERCYACKKEIFTAIKHLAEAEGFDVVFDGANASDLNDFRPGLKAAEELGVVSPFIEAGITKADIYDLSKKYNLPTQNTPANACLATRIPTGEPVDEQKLNTVEMGEEILKKYGFTLVRLRLSNGKDGVLECYEKEFPIFEKNKDKIKAELERIGVNLADEPRAYKQGSMNAPQS